MTTKKSAGVPALRLTLGGAPNTWHMVGELPGLWHPAIAVPIDVVDGTEDWAKPLSDDPGCHLELVFISDKDADAARAAYADAVGASLDELLTRITQRPPAEPDSVEADRVAAEAAQATAKVTKQEKE